MRPESSRADREFELDGRWSCRELHLERQQLIERASVELIEQLEHGIVGLLVLELFDGLLVEQLILELVELVQQLRLFLVVE